MQSGLPLSFALGAALALLVGCSASAEEAESSSAEDGGVTTQGAEALPAASSAESGSEGAASGGSGAVAPGSVPDGGRGSGADGGAATCSGAAGDGAAAATIAGYLDKLPYGAPTGAARSEIIDAVIDTCNVFGPPPSTNPGWKREYCWAHLVASALKESTYNAALTIKDAYASRAVPSGKANDPTVGLLQVRFSSTVRDFDARGPLEELSCAGCTFPATFAAHRGEADSSPFWAVTGPTQHGAVMRSRACNVALGAWYYYVNATANGKPSAPTFVSAYCAGQGTAGNLVTGLLSHLKGPQGGRGVIADMNGVKALQSTDPNAYQYVTTIKTWFDAMVGPVSGTHPFFIKLSPNSTQYCR